MKCKGLDINAGPQYLSLQNLLQQFSTFSARQPNSHLRPKTRPKNRASVVRWWHYAVAASRRQSASITWPQLKKVSDNCLAFLYIACMFSVQHNGSCCILWLPWKLFQVHTQFFHAASHRVAAPSESRCRCWTRARSMCRRTSGACRAIKWAGMQR